MTEFQIIPDNEMRERTRTSRNRVPDIHDWQPGTALTDLMREMADPVGIHRKSWEYAICVQGLRELGVVHETATALAVGAGSERPLYYFANHIAKMVATDLYDNPQHEGTPLMLANPEQFAPFPYRKAHLEVLRMAGDDLRFPSNSFDFCFSLSSIEHFGSRETQRKSFGEMIRVVRPGGIVCIITELIITDHSHTDYFQWAELEDMFMTNPTVELVGGDPDLSISESLVRYPLDLNHSHNLTASPHIVLKEGDMLWTSFSMFFRKRS